jgi:biotin operon repressor
MNRIYLKILKDVVNSDKKSRYFLSYLQIRAASRNRCGGFNLEQLAQTINTSERTARKHISAMIELGYIVKQKSNHYRVVRQKSLFNESRKNSCAIILDCELLSFSWRNMAQFRAYIVELLIQQNRNTRIALRKGIKIINSRGVKEKIKNRTEVKHDNLMASTYAAKLTGKHFTTILKYRKKQNLSEYSPLRIINQSSKEYKFNVEIVKTKEKVISGKEFIFKNHLIFIPISTRICNKIFFKRC